MFTWPWQIKEQKYLRKGLYSQIFIVLLDNSWGNNDRIVENFSSILKIKYFFPAENNRTVEMTVFKKFKSIFFSVKKKRNANWEKQKKQHGVDDFFPFQRLKKMTSNQKEMLTRSWKRSKLLFDSIAQHDTTDSY